MTDEPESEQPPSLLEMIIALRGGLPEKCDFCQQPFTEKRHPVPEEGGEWACAECLERWRRTDPAYR